MNKKFKKLNNLIINCKKCPRLIKFIKKISKVKRKKNINEIYWGKPVTGFGDLNFDIITPRFYINLMLQVQFHHSFFDEFHL